MTETTASNDVCRIFVSRKKDDSTVIDRPIQDALRVLGAGRLEFFDDHNIQAGSKWRDEIRKELDRASILLLVLTKPAREEFDWPLYEAGLFEDLNGGRKKRVVCLHPDEKDRPSQLGDLETVKATKEEILALLCDLFRDASFSGTATPLNLLVTDDQLEPIAEQIYLHVNGRKDNGLKKFEYGNLWVQLVLHEGQETLGPGVRINSDERSLRTLFGLREKLDESDFWTWSDIEASARLDDDDGDFNRRWIDQLREHLAERHKKRTHDQLSGRFLARDGELYRPEIEVYRSYKDGRLTIDVTFSKQVQDEWLKDAGPPVALASMISLASRIRHELIDDYLQKMSGWISEAQVRAGLRELCQLEGQIEAYGFFIQRLSKESLSRAFAGRGKAGRVLAELDTEYRTEIRPQLAQATDELDVTAVEAALERWKENNARFLEIGLDVYADLLGLGEAKAA